MYDFGDEDTGIAPDQNFTSLLRDLTCHSEAIVTGKANASRSHLSTSKSAIYSDYDFQIGGVLKSGSPSKLEPALHIVVTRPGGKLPVSGGSVQYVNQMFLPLRPDTTYLLFLSQIPATGAFQPASLGTNGQVFSSLEMQPFASQWRNLPSGPISSVIFLSSQMQHCGRSLPPRSWIASS